MERDTVSLIRPKGNTRSHAKKGQWKQADIRTFIFYNCLPLSIFFILVTKYKVEGDTARTVAFPTTNPKRNIFIILPWSYIYKENIFHPRKLTTADSFLLTRITAEHFWALSISFQLRINILRISDKRDFLNQKSLKFIEFPFFTCTIMVSLSAWMPFPIPFLSYTVSRFS